MKFYIRELPQKQYHQCNNIIPKVPNNKEIKPGDTWCDTWADYYIDKVTYEKNDLKVFATKTALQKPRKNCCYKCNKNKKDKKVQ